MNINKTEEAMRLIVDGDLGKKTIREYFKELLIALWTEGECFSGKRPLGNSGWEYPFYKTLVEAGIIKGEFDEDGYLDEFDREEGHDVIIHLIKSL